MHPLRSVRSKTLALSFVACLLAGGNPAFAQQGTIAKQAVTLSAKDTPLVAALGQAFASAKARYSITDAAQVMMQPLTVTVELTNVPLSMAVQSLLRTVSSSLPAGKQFVSRIENDAYVIDVGAAPPPPRPTPGPPGVPDNGFERRPVTLDVHDAKLPDVVRALVRQAGLTYRVHPQLASAFSDATVSLSVAQMPVEQALTSALMGAKGLPRATANYTQTEFQILPVSTLPGRLDLSTKTTTLQVVNAPAAAALKALLESAGVDYGFCDDVFRGARVTLVAKNEPLDAALRDFISQIPTDPKPMVNAQGGVVCVFPPVPPASIGPNSLVTLRLHSADARFALKTLFTSVGANYTLDPTVLGTTTVDLQAVPFSQALPRVLRSIPSIDPLAVRFDDNVFNVSAQPIARR